MIFSFIATQRNYPELFILIFNIVFSLTLFIVSLIPVAVFTILIYGIVYGKKE